MNEESKQEFISIDEMREKIEVCGSKGVWSMIEKVGDWKSRTAYRQVFFLADGVLGE